MNKRVFSRPPIFANRVQPHKSESQLLEQSLSSPLQFAGVLRDRRSVVASPKRGETNGKNESQVNFPSTGHNAFF